MLREADPSSEEEEDDAQKCPPSAEHQETPLVRDAGVSVEVAVNEVHVVSVAAIDVYSYVMVVRLNACLDQTGYNGGFVP